MRRLRHRAGQRLATVLGTIGAGIATELGYDRLIDTLESLLSRILP